MQDLIGYTFTDSDGNHAEVVDLERLNPGGYVDVRITSPDGEVSYTLRVERQLRRRIELEREGVR